MERTYKEITLPITGYKIQIYDYYLRGDRIAIEQIMTEAVEMTGEGTVSKVDTGYRHKMEDAAVIRAIKSIKNNGKDVEIVMETIHNLPEDDYEFVRENLPKESGKKSITRPSKDTLEKVQKKEE